MSALLPIDLANHNMRWTATILTWMMFLSGILTAQETSGAPQTEALWVYASANFQVERSVNDLIKVLERAKAAGYSAAVVTDFKFGNFRNRPDHFFRNLQRTRDAAEKLEIELIPCVMPIGYSSSILQNNPDLAAGIPVRKQTLVIRDGRAVVESENLLPGGGFEAASKLAPQGFDWADRFHLDTDVKHGGASSIRMDDFRKENDHGNARIVKNLKLKPWHQYHLRLWIKTRGLDNPNDLGVKPLVGQRSLNHANLQVKRDQDWTQHDISFNSFEHRDVRLYIGLWSGRGGTIWIDDVSLREVAGVNLIRREGCPVHFETEAGDRLQEGRDVIPWRSPKTGRVPYPGEFRAWHEPPAITLMPGSGLQDGQRMRVSYYHTQTVYDGQTCACLIHKDLFGHLRDQVEAIAKIWQPRTYFMQHDEIRVAGWCGLCEDAADSGKLLQENARRCIDLIRAQDPQAGIVVWSDMFDPHHNAHDNFYLVRGNLAESWKGLDDKVVIANWNHGRPGPSFAHFDKRGHRQVVAGYYDRGNISSNLARWREAAQSGQHPVHAFMYTTWRNNYTDLERFAAAVKQPAAK